MALNWDLSGINNYKKLYRKLKEGELGYSSEEVFFTLKPQASRIIDYTMIIGMREITDKNWEKFFNRIEVWEKIKGVNYYKRNSKKLIPIYTKKEDVKSMIGLKTNASSLSQSKFIKQLFQNSNI